MLLLLPFLLGIAAPDSGPFLTRVDIYRHCLETDDMLVVVRYNIPYDVGPPDTIPTETVTQAFIGRFMNGSTELARVSPYSYYRRGYSYGAFSMYLDAASAPDWEGDYTVKLEGSPTLEWDPSTPSVSTGSMYWRATTSTSTTQALLYAHLIAYANELSDYWSIALTSTTSGGEVLSSYGEVYFVSVVAELGTMCSRLFAAGVTTPQYTDVDWQRSQSEATKAAWPFDWGGMSEYFGLPSNDEVFRTLVGFVIVFCLCAMIMARTSRPDFAMLAGYGLIIVLAVPGWMSPVIVAGFTFLSVLGAALVFILGKAG